MESAKPSTSSSSTSATSTTPAASSPTETDAPPPPPPPPPVPVFPTTVTATTPVGGTPLDITRVIQILYQDVELQINRADLKAQITLSTAAILAALVVNVGFGITTLELRQWIPMEWVAGGVYLLFLICLCATIIHALMATYPRAVLRTRNTVTNPSLYFSGHIITLDSEDYAQRFEEQSNAAVLSRLIKQVHAKSRVLELKLSHIRVGLRCLGVALMLWLLARGLLVIAYGKLAG
ncbi:hypothetical protein DES53_12112 [Roseimicrobium gellanilyticum]|uniref:Pycsar effector protein domain-containing protein n=1 Tax=Roseimicrobium gellanilyticum TaxID=748857 RepID=A0A366H3U3_9BACT|nr:Pycsar system effector family protein [Roseimicrobium gellanilyticum]RBP35492.1 hypothetical protein DES53_12112 [Roseimicrobium gellanilyticum]